MGVVLLPSKGYVNLLTILYWILSPGTSNRSAVGPQMTAQGPRIATKLADIQGPSAPPFEDPCCAAIRGPWGQNPGPTFSSLIGV